MSSPLSALGVPLAFCWAAVPPASQPNHRTVVKKLCSAWVVLTGLEFIGPELFESSVHVSTRVITTNSSDQNSKNMHDEARCYQSNVRNICSVCRRPRNNANPPCLCAWSFRSLSVRSDLSWDRGPALSCAWKFEHLDSMALAPGLFFQFLLMRYSGSADSTSVPFGQESALLMASRSCVPGSCFGVIHLMRISFILYRCPVFW